MGLMRLLALSIAAAAILAGNVAATSSPRGTRLTGAEIRQVIYNSYVFDSINREQGWVGSMVIAVTGTVYTHWRVAPDKIGQDSGTWRIVGDTYCSQLTHRGGGELCYQWYKVGEGEYESWLDGQLTFSAAFHVRNP